MAQLIYLKDVVTLRLDAAKCTGCGVCMEVCPQGVLARDNKKIRVGNKDACIECGACAKNCPVEALEVRVGVGCAAAVINAALGRTSSSCCCVIEPEQTEADGKSGSGGFGCC